MHKSQGRTLIGQAMLICLFLSGGHVKVVTVVESLSWAMWNGGRGNSPSNWESCFQRKKSSEHWLLAISGKVCGQLGTAGGLGYYLMVIKGLKNTESKLHLSNSFAGVQPVNVTKSKCRKGPKSLRVLRVTLQKYCVRHLQVTDVTKPRSATLWFFVFLDSIGPIL